MKGLLLNTLLLLALTGFHPNSSAASGECEATADTITRLQQLAQQQQPIRQQLESVFSDDGATRLSLETLENILTSQLTNPVDAEDDDFSPCKKLRQAFEEERENAETIYRQIKDLRSDYWAQQPDTSRRALLSVWRSRQRLLQHREFLLKQPEVRANSELVRQLNDIYQHNHSQRKSFFELLPTLGESISARQAALWIDLWRSAMDLPGRAADLDPGLVDGLDSELQPLIKLHLRIAELDALVMANVINNIRGWLWQNSRDQFQAALPKLELTSKDILTDEVLAIGDILRWLYIDALVDFRPDGRVSIFQRVFYGFEYLLGLFSFVVLAYLAKKLRNAAAGIQDQWSRKRIRSRLAIQLLRISAGISVLLPWLFGLGGLALLESCFKQYKIVLLLPLIPFGRLYILYGLLRLFGEWYLNRVNERGGVFLTSSQSRSIRNRARLAAAIAMLPLLVHDFVGLAIGPSQLLTVLLWIMLASVFTAISLLLLPWRETYISALQSFLPEVIDPWIERMLTPRLMPVLGPVLSPVLLGAMLVTFLHRALVDFDWYRKLMARSFKLRSSASDKELSNDSDANALEQYSQWFGETLPNQELPVIKVELIKYLQEVLSPWLENQSEENSLLLSGERGSGKSVALRHMASCLSQENASIKVRTVSVPAKTCTSDDVSALLAEALEDDRIDGPGALVKTDGEREPTILVLENAQNFFLRQVGSLEAWETLLSYTKARVSNIFWIVVINNQSWAYLSRVFGGDYQFSNVIRTRPWSQSEIRSLILSRHQLSEFKIRYDDILLSTRGPEAGSVRNAEQLYFSLLWDSCGGNPLLALAMWLSSVNVYGRSVTVGLPSEVSASALEHLSDELHFVYAALLIHENLSSDELVAVTALPHGIVRAALKTAFDLGFVTRSGDRRYRIVPMWYPTISKLLTRKNLLHE